MADLSQISTDELLKMLQGHAAPDTRFPVTVGSEGMPQALKQEAASRSLPGQFMAGVGTAVNDAAMRLKQLTGNTLTQPEISDVQAGRQLRGVSNPALLGGMGGQIAMTYPIAPQTLVGNAVAGGTLGGLMEPVLPGESTAKNMMRGAAGGAAGYGLAKGIGFLARPITPSPEVNKLVSEGIVPTPGQAARSTQSLTGRAIGGIEDAATSIPVFGDLVKGARNRAGQELQQAAIARATPQGITPAGIGREGIEQTSNAISDAYGMALDKIGTVKLDTEFLNSAPKIVQRAVALNPEQKSNVANVVEQVISSRVNPAGGTIPARVAKTIDSDLGAYARNRATSSVASEREVGAVIQEIQKEWRNLITRNAPDEATTELLKDANRSFANLLRVEKASIKGASSAGEFTPAQLNMAVRELTPNKRVFAKGKSLMQDLSEPAAQVLTGKLGESGTIPRGLIGMGLLGGGVANQQLGGPDWLTNIALTSALLGPLYSRSGSQYAIGQLVPSIQQPLAQGMNAIAPYAGILGRSYVQQR